jgi:3-oxoacyl-[acyl-carrier protein] reductase
MLVINGATGSIGGAIVEVATKEFKEVIGIGRDISRLKKLESRYGNFKGFQISDVANEKEAEILCQNIFSSTQKPVAYIHTIGIIDRNENSAAINSQIWEKVIHINLFGTYIWNQIFLENFKKHKISGSIVNLTSQAYRTGGYGYIPAYAASKGGIVSMSKSFARHGGEFGIRVNCVSPGFLENKMMTNGLSESQIAYFENKTLLKHLGTDLDAAKACVFLAGSDSQYITGEVLDVSGGNILG